MKKTKLAALACAGIMAMTMGLTACKNQEEGKAGVKIDLAERQRYDNIFGEENIPDQWTDYGVGDPYVMRWNGEYYLYVSSKNFMNGYRLWKSKDLIHYEYLGEHRLEGADGDDSAHHTAYAPEVYYWNGDFYMYCSPDGKGHYIYKSTNGKPDGDFRALTPNIGLSIDGSVFIDDDEKMYFYSAGEGYIRGYEMTNMENIVSSSETELNTPLQRWTEGPYVLKRDGKYYITYTGNHVKSRGYRVDYSYSTTNPIRDYVYPSNNSVLLNSMGNQNGLGHSSTVMGPDLDSYWIAYHNLDSASGPIRSFNINRLTFSGTRMSAYGPTEKGAQVPAMPAFYVLADGTSYAEGRNDALEDKDGFRLSNKSTAKEYSAEFSFSNIATDGSFRAVFDHEGGNYHYVTVNGKKIELHAVAGGDTLVAEGTLVNDFDFTKLHTLRVTAKEGRVTVAFDNMTKIDKAVSGIGGGKIGYAGTGSAQIGTTVFSDYAFDSSDYEEAKIVDGDFFAENYSRREGTYSLTGNSGVRTLEADVNDDRNIYSEANTLLLAGEDDFVSYPLDVLHDGLYGLESTFRVSEGTQISLSVDGGTPVVYDLRMPDYGANMGSFEKDLVFAKQLIGEMRLTKGIHTLTVRLLKGEFEASEFNFFSSSEQTPVYASSLENIVEKGAEYFTLWKIKDGVHYSKSGIDNLVMFGSEKMTDYTVSVEIKIDQDSLNNARAGFVVRMNNPSIMSGQNAECMQGYLITFNHMQLTMSRMNYNDLNVAVKSGNFELGKWHELKAVVKGNTVTVSFDGERQFSYTDPYPFLHGSIGLYSISSETSYKNLKITAAE